MVAAVAIIILVAMMLHLLWPSYLPQVIKVGRLSQEETWLQVPPWDLVVTLVSLVTWPTWPAWPTDPAPVCPPSSPLVLTLIRWPLLPVGKVPFAKIMTLGLLD